MTLIVGQKVIVFDSLRRGTERYEGVVVRVGRKLATIEWSLGGFSPIASQFRMEEGIENTDYGHRWFKTVERAEEDDRLADAKATLREAGLEIGYDRSRRLTNPQLEELAVVVRNMLAENPADRDSEVGR